MGQLSINHGLMFRLGHNTSTTFLQRARGPYEQGQPHEGTRPKGRLPAELRWSCQDQQKAPQAGARGPAAEWHLPGHENRAAIQKKLGEKPSVSQGCAAETNELGGAGWHLSSNLGNHYRRVISPPGSHEQHSTYEQSE